MLKTENNLGFTNHMWKDCQGEKSKPVVPCFIKISLILHKVKHRRLQLECVLYSYSVCMCEKEREGLEEGEMMEIDERWVGR